MRRSSLALALLLLAGPAHAFRAGQTVPFKVVVPNLAGVATDAVTLKAYVYNGTSCIDSTKSLAGGQIAKLPLAESNTTRVYAWTWTVPANLASTSAWLSVVCRATTADITTQDWLLADPSRVPVNAVTPDTLLSAVTADLWAQYADANTAIVKPGSYGATTVTLAGQPVQGAIVTLSSDAAGTLVIGWALSDALGSYVIPVSVSPTEANTFYLWARRGVQLVKTSETITVP